MYNTTLMKITIPSTTVKCRFLKTLPLGTIFKDPRNNHVYEVQEKKIGNCYSKIAVPHFGEDEPIELDVPAALMKVENPERANVMVRMKQKLAHLETVNGQLMNKLGLKSRFDQIQELMEGRKYHIEEEDGYLIDSGVIFHLRKKDCKDGECLKTSLDNFCDKAWNDTSSFMKVMDRQQRLQQKLLSCL
jgi:hypothetical protein